MKTKQVLTLNDAIEACGLNQVHVGVFLGCSQGTVSKIANCWKEPTEKQVRKLKSILKQPSLKRVRELIAAGGWGLELWHRYAECDGKKEIQFIEVRPKQERSA